MPVKFLVDWTRCIKCSGCEAACKQYNKVPTGIRRIRVVTINEGKRGQYVEKHIPMACFHCADAPCMKACPVKAIYKTEDGVVLVDKDKCIGCGYCLWACPFGAPQFPEAGTFGSKGKMDKCTFCLESFDGEKREKPVAMCAAFCATKALLAGEASEISKEYRERAAGRIIPFAL